MKINFNSITLKTLLHISIFSLAFIFFTIFAVRTLFVNSYMELEKDKVSLVSEHIKAPLSLNLSYGFTEALTDISTKALENPNILLIEIEDYQNTKFYSFSKYKLSLKEHSDNHELINTIELIDPASELIIGELTIVYSNASYEKYMHSFNKLFFSGILGYALSLLILLYLLYRSLKNLAVLDTALKNFNPKEPEKLKLEGRDKDEIYSISQSANIMIENIITYFDATKELNSQLILSQSHLKDAQRMARVGSFEYDIKENRFLMSDEYYRILGTKLNTSFVWESFLSLISENDYTRVKSTFDKAIETGSQFSLEYTLSLNANKKIHVLTKGKVRKKKDGSVKMSAISMDITKDIQNQKTIEKLAYFDALTGLANRTLLRDRMHKAVQNAQRNDEKLGVVFLDLDHFKLINDTLGHSVGDELLIYISEILKEQTRDSDTLARLGGDEFLILLPSIKDITDVEHFAAKILTALEHKHNIGIHQLYITSSIGVSIYPEHGTTCDELIRNADTAMYEAKNNGRNKFKTYSQTMGNYVDKQLNLEQDLTEAVKSKEQIEVYYQVKMNANSKKIIGAEALVRWNHPTNGLIFPDDFIYMAESTGLMVELGNIITRQSISMVKKLNAIGYTDIKMAINLSARQFQDSSLVPFISQMLSEYDVDPSQLEFEITESISMANVSNTLRILTQLQEIGVSIAIDDFGTGHSSLSYLKKFPINTLKIDKSFVMGITDNDEDKVIAQTIITMAHSLGLKTVAEGVETKAHVDMLQEMDCDILQGYYYSKPVTEKAFKNFIHDYKINN